MKIGIDAKWYFNGPPSGKVVIRQLLSELLSDKFSNIEFYVFLKNTDKSEAFPFNSNNIKCVYINSYNNLISNAMILPREAKKIGLDVLLFQNFGSFSNSIKSVVYIHDLLYLDFPKFYSFKEKLYMSFLKPLAKRANTIITISQTEKERIIRHGLGKNNVHFVYHGVDGKFKPLINHNKNDIYKLKKKYNLPKQFILYLGRLNIRKNISSLISALQFIDIPLVIVGNKDHKFEDLSLIIKTAKLENRIVFTGHIKDDELPLMYALATIFCFPSYAEGFGLPPLEAMASGVPVVVSDRTSLPEVCKQAAIYVNPDEPRDIAEKINILLESPDLINAYIQKGLSHSNKFTWKESARNLMNIIKKTYDS